MGWGVVEEWGVEACEGWGGGVDGVGVREGGEGWEGVVGRSERFGVGRMEVEWWKGSKVTGLQLVPLNMAISSLKVALKMLDAQIILKK